MRSRRTTGLQAGAPSTGSARLGRLTPYPALLASGNPVPVLFAPWRLAPDSPSPRPGASRWRPKGFAKRRPAAATEAPPEPRRSSARTCSRSIRSTCWCAPITCRCSRGIGAYDRGLLDRAAYHRKKRASLRVLGPRGLADPARPASAVSAGAWSGRRAARAPMAGWPGSAARSAPSSRRCGARSQTRGPIGCRRAVRTAARARAPGGAGATASGRSNGCSGPARSPPRRGAASSASTTCRSGCCRPRSSNAPTPSGGRGAARACCALSIRALGIASERCLRDYFRLEPPDAKARIPRTGRGGRRCCRSRSRAGPGRSISTRRRAMPAPRRGARAAVAVRSHRLGAHAHRAPVRFPLPHRDLHAGREARIRLLLPALPARRQDRRAGRPQGRPRRRATSSSIRSTRKPDVPAGGDRPGARRGASPHGRVAQSRHHHRAEGVAKGLAV